MTGLGPLGKFLVLETDDVDEFSEALVPLVGHARLEGSRNASKFGGRIEHLQFGDIGLLHCKYYTGFNAYFPDFQVYGGSGSPLRGSGVHEIGGKEVSVSKGHGAIVSPGSVRFNYGPRFEHLSLLVQPRALTSKLIALVDCVRNGSLCFEPSVDARNPQCSRLDRLIRFIAAEADSCWPPPTIMQAELAQAVMTAFLLANPNNYSAQLYGETKAAAAWQVRLAEQFIEANWDRPLTVEALAAATNVSIRSLFYTFRQSRGCTPKEFIKRVRLGRARQTLTRPDAETSVTEVAFACGFGNASHFAKDYRIEFGETPSQTLARTRGGPKSPRPSALD